MCRADDSDSVDFFHSKMRQARKSHQCDECHRRIEAAEFYRYDFYVWEGSAFHGRLCAHCLIPIGWLTKNCGGWVSGEVLEEIEEHAEHYPDLAGQLRDCVAGMASGWKSGTLLLPVPTMPDAIHV